MIDTTKLASELLGVFEGKNEYAVYYKQRPDFMIPDSIDMETFVQDYVHIGTIKADGKEQVFRRMQGENWSPNGEARPLIRALNLTHTSMSLGDIVRNIKTGKYFMVNYTGFKKLEI